MKVAETVAHYGVFGKLGSRGMCIVLALTFFACGRGWSPPELIGDASSSGGFGDAVALGVSASGRAMVIWKKHSEAAETVVARTFELEHGWGPEACLSGDLSSVYYPGVSMDGAGNATAVWRGFEGADARLEVRRFRTDVGWEPSETLGTRSGSALVAMNRRGDTALLWSQSDRLFFRLDAPGGRGTPQDIGRRLGYDVGALGIGLDDSGAAIAAFAEGYPSSFHGSAALFTRVMGPRSDWREPEVRAVAWSVSVQNLVMNGGGDGLLLWNTYVGAATAFQADRYRPGRGWLKESLAPGLTGTPAAGLDSQGNGWALFPSGTDPRQWDALSSRRLRAGSGWQPPQTVSSTSSTDVRDLDVALTPRGPAVAVWTASIESRRAVLASQSTSEETWRRPEVVVEREETTCDLGGRSGVFAPHVGIDGRGNAIAVWIDWDCNANRATVWASRLAPGES